MAYADQDTMSTRKVVSIGLVVALHALLGYAFITGLAQNVIKKAQEDLTTVDVKEPPPPPDIPPPPPPETPKVAPPPPVVAPPTIVKTPIIQSPVSTVQLAPPPVITPKAPTAPPAPPAPPAPVVSKAVGVKGNPSSWTSDSDYPSEAIRNEEQGTVGFKLDIGADGRVSNCTVTSPSGSASLDSTTCRLLSRRAKFSPALDQSGSPMASSYSSRIRWVLPKD